MPTVWAHFSRFRDECAHFLFGRHFSFICRWSSGPFGAALHRENLEIQKVFLRLSWLALPQKSSLSIRK